MGIIPKAPSFATFLSSDVASPERMNRVTVPPATARRLARIDSRLARRFRTIEQPVLLPQSQALCHVLVPASFDRLLTAAATDPEQNLPYWATIWPSGIALGDVALQYRDRLAGRRAIELGCGLGTTAIAAAAVGAQLTITDYSPDTLLLARANVLRNTGVDLPTLRDNWRQPSRALLDVATPPLPIVLAADVLYESRDVEPLVTLVERIVAPGGELWLAEPGRPPAQRFVNAVRLAGWTVETIEHHGPWPDLGDAHVIVRVHLIRRPMKD